MAGKHRDPATSQQTGKLNWWLSALFFALIVVIALFVIRPGHPGITIAMILLACTLGFSAVLLVNRTHRHAAEMRDETMKNQMLLNAVSDAILICKLRPGGYPGCFVQVNQAACRILGYSQDEFLKMTIMDVMARNESNEDREIDFTRQTVEDTPLRCRDGTVQSFESTSIPLVYHDQPHVLFAQRLLQAKTETGDQEASIRARIDSANRVKSAFLANMSHEIRTPMNAILGYTQLLRRDRSLGVEAREHLDVIHRSGEHLLALITDVLELSKIEAGRAVLNDEQFDMVRLMTDLQRMFQLRVKQKCLCFSVESTSGFAGSIIADQGKIRQILINMLGNAVKFTDKGGIIVRYGSDLPSSHSEKITIWVEVEDTGRGISDEDLPKVFRPFEQVASAGSEGGTGLGMTISRQYARLMEGDILVRSALKRGTTFRLEFKAIPAYESLGEELQNTTVLKLLLDREYTILVADDRDHNRKLVQTVLTRNGFQVKTAVDGHEAIEKFKTESPHLVLIDLKTPSMTGYDTAKIIRTLPRGVEVPILLLTGTISDLSVTEDDSDLFNGIIRKPFKDTELLVAVRDALRLDYSYEYEPKIPDAVFSTTQMKVSSRIIPPDSRLALSNAIRSGDMDRFADLTENLSVEHPLMAARLRQYADDFDFDKLLLILEDPEKDL